MARLPKLPKLPKLARTLGYQVVTTYQDRGEDMVRIRHPGGGPPYDVHVARLGEWNGLAPSDTVAPTVWGWS